MVTKGRVVAIAIVALGLGFLGGVWVVASGALFRLIPPPEVEPQGLAANARPPGAPAVPKRPIVKAVDVPKTKNFGVGSAGLEPVADRTDLMPAPGCSWVVEPRPFRLGASWHQTDAERALGGDSSIEPMTGALRYLLVQSTRQGSALELRPVFFDAQANRHIPGPGRGGMSRNNEDLFTMTTFYVDPVHEFALDKIAYFGIERVVSDADRLLAEAAQKEAKDKGIEIPPLPAIGKPFPFDLPTPDGQRMRAADYRGKAVLLVVWGPGAYEIGTMAHVKNVREKNKADELAIVGVSFDGSAEDARQTFTKSGADGPFVLVPNDTVSRRLWREGVQFTNVPRLYLIDREGVLRFTCSTFDVQDHIDILFGRAKRFHPRPARGGTPAKTAPGVPPAGIPKVPMPSAVLKPGA